MSDLIPSAGQHLVTQEQVNQLKAMRDRIPNLEREIQLAERAGIQIPNARAELAQLKAEVDRLIDVYDIEPGDLK